MDDFQILQGKVLQQAAFLLNQWAESQVNGDMKSFQECFCVTPKLVNIGTDQDEFWLGWDLYASYMSKCIQEKKGLEITQRDTLFYINRQQDVIWYSQLIDSCYETKGEMTRIEGFRHSGVLLCINNTWKIVQTHISAPLTDSSSH